MAATHQYLSNVAKLPKLWQPRLNEWSPYHSSHPDVSQAGWRKWSAEHPDYYAMRSTSRHPDWFNRRVNTIRRADYKNVNWHYERPSKPTSRKMDDFVPRTNEVMHQEVIRPMPHNKGYHGSFSYPKPFPQEVLTPKWGLYHPDHYEEPIRFNHYPPVRYDGYDDVNRTASWALKGSL